MKRLYAVLLILFCTVMAQGQIDPRVIEVVNDCITISESIVSWNKTHSFSELNSSNWREILFPQQYVHDGDILIAGKTYFQFYSGGNDANGIALIATSVYAGAVKHRMDIANPQYAASLGRPLVVIYEKGNLDNPWGPRLIFPHGPYIKAMN